MGPGESLIGDTRKDPGPWIRQMKFKKRECVGPVSDRLKYQPCSEDPQTSLLPAKSAFCQGSITWPVTTHHDYLDEKQTNHSHLFNFWHTYLQHSQFLKISKKPFILSLDPFSAVRTGETTHSAQKVKSSPVKQKHLKTPRIPSQMQL